jgi:hypothetical protein
VKDLDYIRTEKFAPVLGLSILNKIQLLLGLSPCCILI